MSILAPPNVSFSIIPDEASSATYRVVPLVDGIPLTELCREFEAARSYHPAGGYGGLAPELFRFGPLDRYFLGQAGEDSYWITLGEIYLLGCQCGEVGCWPLVCQVRVTDQHVTWSQFKNHQRPERDYSGFGPFVFDAVQYRVAVARLNFDLPVFAS